MKKILIAGGAGFIGSHLCERLLCEGNEIICLDNFSTGKRRNISIMTGKDNFQVIEHNIIEPISLAGIDEGLEMTIRHYKEIGGHGEH